MSSQVAVHAAKRKLQLSPGDRDAETAKKFKVVESSTHTKSIDSSYDQDGVCSLEADLKVSTLDEKDTVWSEDHYKVEVCDGARLKRGYRNPATATNSVQTCCNSDGT